VVFNYFLTQQFIKLALAFRYFRVAEHHSRRITTECQELVVIQIIAICNIPADFYALMADGLRRDSEYFTEFPDLTNFQCCGG